MLSASARSQMFARGWVTSILPGWVTVMWPLASLICWPNQASERKLLLEISSLIDVKYEKYVKRLRVSKESRNRWPLLKMAEYKDILCDIMRYKSNVSLTKLNWMFSVIIELPRIQATGLIQHTLDATCAYSPTCNCSDDLLRGSL